MAFVEGRITTLRVDLDGVSTYTDVGGLKECSIDFETTSIDTTTHGTSRNKTYIAGRFTATLTGSCFFDDSDGGQVILIEAASPEATPTNSLIYFEYDVGDSGSLSSYKAQGFLTSLGYSGPNDDASTLDFSAQLTGAVTIA